MGSLILQMKVNAAKNKSAMFKNISVEAAFHGMLGSSYLQHWEPGLAQISFLVSHVVGTFIFGEIGGGKGLGAFKPWQNVAAADG